VQQDDDWKRSTSFWEGKFAAKLSDAAKALESVAGVLDEAAPVPQG